MVILSFDIFDIDASDWLPLSFCNNYEWRFLTMDIIIYVD